nr:hypothetical protein [uncultured Steroidobacter sp.]
MPDLLSGYRVDSGMTQYGGYGHCVTELVNVGAQHAFDFLSNPLSVGTWSLGCMHTEATAEPGRYVGTSLFDGQRLQLHVKAARELLLIDYLVGAVEPLRPRISVRIVAAETCDLIPSQCYVSLMAWRSTQMTADRWSQLCASHEAEIWLIKARLEATGGIPSVTVS